MNKSHSNICYFPESIPSQVLEAFYKPQREIRECDTQSSSVETPDRSYAVTRGS